MKSLSVKNPYATLIMKGLKTIEVRSRKTDYRGKLLICVSKNLVYVHQVYWPNDEFPKFENVHDFYENAGMAIATVEIVDVTPFLPKHESAAFVKYNPHVQLHAWHLANVTEIVPFEVTGMLGFFETNDNLIIEFPFNHR
ncbi:MAG: ASCH domain-containing protein [Bacteroidales bacterium]|nr:ASCH domain-containing protein [Bacteroidales bacterium]